MTTTQHPLIDAAQRFHDDQQRLAKAARDQRAAIPPEPIAADYTFTRTDGSSAAFADLFGPHADLIVIHNMGRSCSYCAMWADGFIGLARHLNHRCALALTSPDEHATLRDIANERGWNFPCYAIDSSTFARDMGFATDAGGYLPGVSAFHRGEDGTIARTAAARFGPGDVFNPAWHLFDMLPAGPDGFSPR